jgi:enterochelin esterase-like enzyme
VGQAQLDRGAPAADALKKKVMGPAATSPAQVARVSPSQFNRSGVATFTVRGRASGITGQVMVQLPPGYFSSGDRHAHYPVIEAFMGYPGALSQWIGEMNLGGDMAQLAEQGRLRPAIVVSPQTEVPGGVDTECVNGTAGRPQVETWLTKDVPAWVARTFRVRTDRGSWATIGLSAGGWCAAMASMLHPAQYAASIVMAGYFRPEPGPFYDPYPASSSLNKRYDLVALARNHPPPVTMWLQTSHADPVSFAPSAEFLRAVRPPLSVHAVVLRHAGHRIQLWQALLPQALRWLGATLPGFR